jgi:hypothetical protein
MKDWLLALVAAAVVTVFVIFCSIVIVWAFP